MLVSGFDWDSGNWPKCGKHGVSRREIEEMLLSEPVIEADPHPSEQRYRAIKQNSEGRYLFVIFTLRLIKRGLRIRPVSARYMHQKEVNSYAEEEIDSVNV